jgi:hypothetical protein
MYHSLAAFGANSRDGGRLKNVSSSGSCTGARFLLLPFAAWSVKIGGAAVRRRDGNGQIDLVNGGEGGRKGAGGDAGAGGVHADQIEDQ